MATHTNATNATAAAPTGPALSRYQAGLRAAPPARDFAPSRLLIGNYAWAADAIDRARAAGDDAVGIAYVHIVTATGGSEYRPLGRFDLLPAEPRLHTLSPDHKKPTFIAADFPGQEGDGPARTVAPVNVARTVNGRPAAALDYGTRPAGFTVRPAPAAAAPVATPPAAPTVGPVPAPQDNANATADVPTEGTPAEPTRYRLTVKGGRKTYAADPTGDFVRTGTGKAVRYVKAV